MGIMRSLFGSPTPPLRPKGPAPFAQPQARDRQALFWWLKRNTSYTAIAHNAKLWEEFLADWEKWLRGMENPSEHLTDTFKYALDTQLFYERGLKRLRQGDRSVFDRKSSVGWLGKVNTALVDRRMEWYAEPEVIAEQNGVPLSLLFSYYKAHNAAMAIAGWECGHSGDQFSVIRAFAAAMPAPLSTPEPRWGVSFAPGKRAAKDGIYEQVNTDGHIVGSMAYFVKGDESAKEDWLEFGPKATRQDTSAFLWRLLWEDIRYKDGTIPDEERLYPTPEQSVAATEPAANVAGLRCEAGEPCPREGLWFTPAQPNSLRRFAAGDVMPDAGSEYGTTIWQWQDHR